jgi:hypothetical protein
MDEIFNSLNITNNNIKKNIIKSLQGKIGPTDSSNWLSENILIGRMPNDCNEIEKIIKTGVSIFISLREYQENYLKCINELDNKIKHKEFFTRFDIPDFGTRDADLIKSLIDNIINYININQKKIMIHCLGGHGRTGMVVVPLITVLFFLKEIKNKKSKNYIDKNQKLNWISWNNKINIIAEDLLKKSQAYVMICLRKYRKTNELKTVKQITVPETHAQEEIDKEIIKLYIYEYLKN